MTAGCLLALVVALVVTAFTSSTSGSSDDLSSTYYSYDFHPDCDTSYEPSYIGDGRCYGSLNVASCGWDGGDCCVCTCNSNTTYDCVEYDGNCEDPMAPLYLVDSGCQNISLQVPPVEQCSQDQVQWVIGNTANATALADATLCSGGKFDVQWRGHVYINETINVLNGTRLNITGTLDAVVDGGGAVQIFFVYNGSLDINNIKIANGTGDEGGAIVLAANSELIIDTVVFSSNIAQNVGGAIYATSSNVELSSATFDSNTAPNGGAMFVRNSAVVGVDDNIFTNNIASENGGALYIMGTSNVWWNVRRMFNGTIWYSSTSFLRYYYPSYYSWAVIDDDTGETTLFNNSAGGSGGAIYVDTSGILWSGIALLEQNSAWYGGALYLENGATVYSEGTTTFASNDAIFDGGAIGATDGFVELSADGSTVFTNNTSGVNGGAIELSNIDFVVDGNVTFSHNTARSFGGALYASQVDEGYTLNGVTFSGNSAESGGAVFFSAVGTDLYQYSSPDYETIAIYASTFNGCRFDGNSASSKGGAIYSALGSDLMLNTAFESNSADIGGGMSISGTVNLYNSSFENNTSGDGGGPAISNGGIISKMVGLLFLGNGYHCSSDTFMGLNKSDAEDYRYEIVCDGCDIDCERCKIEDEHSTPACLDLLDHTQSEGGTATLETLVVDRGYWRASTTSKNILACFNEKACRGGVTGSPDYCMTGYEGPYCSVCGQDWVRTISHRCSKCSSKTSFGPAVFAVFGGLAGLMLLLFVYYMVLIEGGRTARHSVDRFKKVLAIQSLKIIIVSWQIVTQFSEITNVVYPSLYKGLLDVVAVVNFDFSWILSAGCFDIDFYVGLIAATACPLAVMALLGVTYTIALRRNRGTELGRRIVRRKHVNTVILLAFLVYSSASSAVFRTFVCDSLDDGNEYLRADYRIICTTSKHRAFQIYAGFMIAVYPLGIPVLFAILLFRNRKVLENAALRTYNGELLQQSTSSLWKPYKPSVFYYEVVECGRRLMLAGIMVFIYPNTAAQIAVTLAMAFIFALTSERLNPHESRGDGWVARIGHIMVLLTMFVALLTKVDVSSEGTQSQDMFAVILVTAHIAMVLTGVTEAVLLICSVQENDSPLPRPRRVLVLPVDNFSSMHDKRVDRELDR